MQISFSKYQGTGNDFILIDGRHLEKVLHEETIAELCHRHFGIGADGLIILNPAEEAGIDYAMIYYNSDGKVGSMCGNGARCAFHFANRIGLAEKSARFAAYDGTHDASLLDDGIISVSLRDVMEIDWRESQCAVLDTGSPHMVCFTPNIKSIDVYQEGRAIRYNDEFASAGINVNFAQIEHSHIRVRTYERGVENITLSCGTGVTAVALAFADQQKLTHGPVAIIADGGNLAVDFKKDNGRFTDVRLVGRATPVFEGTVEFPDVS